MMLGANYDGEATTQVAMQVWEGYLECVVGRQQAVNKFTLTQPKYTDYEKMRKR